MIGEPRYKVGGGHGFRGGTFLGHYYKNDLYYSKETDMVFSMTSDYVGTSCGTFLVERVTNPKDSLYPHKKALDLAIKFNLKEDEPNK